jgi:hypothetical protein
MDSLDSLRERLESLPHQLDALARQSWTIK